MRNEATVDSSRHKAVAPPSPGRAAPELGRKRVRKPRSGGHDLAQDVSPGDRWPSPLSFSFSRQTEGMSEEGTRQRPGRRRDQTFDFLKNEATDLLDNKGSELGGMRNEATGGKS